MRRVKDRAGKPWRGWALREGEDMPAAREGGEGGGARRCARRTCAPAGSGEVVGMGPSAKGPAPPPWLVPEPPGE